jgi:hypothetical protein
MKCDEYYGTVVKDVFSLGIIHFLSSFLLTDQGSLLQLTKQKQ